MVSLAEARDAAFENRRLVQRGGDPLAAKRRARVPTFREAADKTLQANRPRWRDAKTAKNWIQALEKRAFPAIGAMPVDRIGREDILKRGSRNWFRWLMGLWSRGQQTNVNGELRIG